MMDLEKKTPLEDVAPETDIGGGETERYKVSEEEERKVRWKIDLVVLPMVSSIRIC